MTFRSIPSSIKGFLKAAEERDPDGIYRVFAQGATVSDFGVDYEGENIRTWIEQRCIDGDVTFRMINASRTEGKFALTLLTSSGHNSHQVNGWMQSGWLFRIQDDKIISLDLVTEQRPDLPAVIVDYINATNSFNADALAAVFTEGALVNDQQRDYWGRAEIKQWAAREIVGEKVTMYVTKVVYNHNNVVVTANVTGEYDKRGLPDPLELNFYFSSHNDRIAQLIILNNNPPP